MRIDETTAIHLNSSIGNKEEVLWKNMETVEQTPASFTHWLAEQADTVNQKLLRADGALQQLASGQAPSLHQTMLTLEDAKLSFQFLEQIRNRIMAAWQDIYREQI